jgi:DNA-binding SARP family transcriptional activator/tetratricopeptide (TPR) repeat protein
MSPQQSLHIQLLGDLVLTRGGSRLELPPSRKTRALLAYLVVTGRAQRRDRLCSMFWDVADDPRGALRWSLSKLRGLVDEPGRSRIEADREQVRFEAQGCRVDALLLRDELQACDLHGEPIERLERWAQQFRGELLEGLDLPDFDDYQAWCVAEREQMRKLRALLLSVLVQRLVAEPERALPHARAFAQAEPLDVAARVALLRAALDAGRPEEAAQHFAAGKRVLEELGSSRVGEFSRAWHELQAHPTDSSGTPVTSTGASASAAAPPSRPAPTVEGTDLVGRQTELATLEALLERARSARQVQVVLLTGEPGIGKTRLCAELRRSAVAGGGSALLGAAYESESSRPYGPWFDALRAATAEGTLPAATGDALAALASDAGAEASRDRLFSSIATLLAQHVHRGTGPALVVLDDVQWLDRASSELLHYVMRSLASEPVLFVLAARGEELPDNSGLSRVLRSLRRDQRLADLPLQALSPDDIGRLLDRTGSSLPAQRVFEQSGGNPLFALELVRGGADGGDTLPRSAAAAVRDRVERLPPDCLEVLRWGAVLGGTFGAARLEALTTLPGAQVVEALERLARHALIRERGDQGTRSAYVFAHELVRRVVYADLSQPRRELMHRRVAMALQEGRDLDGELATELAHHATLGQADDLAAVACVHAARHCLRLFAHEEALLLARRGAKHAERLDGTERVQRLIELCDLQSQAGPRDRIEELTHHLETLAEQALELGLHEHARSAFYALSVLDWRGNDFDQARQRSLQAVTVSRGGSGTVSVQGMADAARCLALLERDLPDALALLREAQVRGRALNLEPFALLDGLGILELHQGRHAQAGELFERARLRAQAERDRLHEFYALEHLAQVRLERRDWDGLAQLATALVELGARLPEGSESALAQALGALADHGRGTQAGAALEQAFGALRLADAKQRLAHCLCHAARIDLERGDATAARSHAEQALPLAAALERPSETLLAHVFAARACARLNDTPAARVHEAAIAARDWHDASREARSEASTLLGRSTETPRIEEDAWS